MTASVQGNKSKHPEVKRTLFKGGHGSAKWTKTINMNDVGICRHYPEGITSFKENVPGVQGAA